MVLSVGVKVLCFVFCSYLMNFGTCTQDQTSSRPNTLSDDADDIQRQLDNEARDRIKFGRPKTVWVLHFPTVRPRKYDLDLDYPGYPDPWETTTIPTFKQPVEVKAVIKKPCVEVKAILKKPEVEVTAVLKKPEVETKAILKKPEVEAKAVLKKPDTEAEAVLKKPDTEEKAVLKKPDSLNNSKNVTTQKPKHKKIKTHKPKRKKVKKHKKHKKPKKPKKNIPPKKPIRYKLPKVDESLVKWDYASQAKWPDSYPNCGGENQSPVDLPKNGLTPSSIGENVIFGNSQVVPNSISLKSDGQRIIMSGTWADKERPLLFGGTVECRRYWFHSLVLHWPSEHTVSGSQYPVESQLLFVSADYEDYEEAMMASDEDPQAMLGVVSLYKYGNQTERGLKSIIEAATCEYGCNSSCLVKPLAYFVPALSEYASYHGSLPTPPCTETVLWLVRGRALPVTKEDVAKTNCILNASGQSIRYRNRSPQSLNRRDILYYKKP